MSGHHPRVHAPSGNQDNRPSRGVVEAAPPAETVRERTPGPQHVRPPGPAADLSSIAPGPGMQTTRSHRRPSRLPRQVAQHGRVSDRLQHAGKSNSASGCRDSRLGGGSMSLRLGRRLYLRFNPGIGLSQAFHKRQAWLPRQFLLDQAVIGVPSPHAQRPGHMIDGQFLPSDFH